MSGTTTRGRSRLRTIRLDVPGDCVCAPALLRTIKGLQRELQEAHSRNCELVARLERQRAISRDRASVFNSAAAYVERHPTLTAREREVLRTFLEFPNDKQVALKLGTRLQTVRNQVRTIQLKLGVATRAEMVVALFGRRMPRGNTQS